VRNIFSARRCATKSTDLNDFSSVAELCARSDRTNINADDKKINGTVNTQTPKSLIVNEQYERKVTIENESTHAIKISAEIR
jgi:hypothetical protein